MNKPIALLAFLWKHNLPFIKAYLQRNPRHIFLMPGYADAETVKELEATGSQVTFLNMQVDQSVSGEADRVAGQARQSLQGRAIPKALPCAINGEALVAVYEGALSQYLPSVLGLLNALQQIENEYFIEAVLLNEESLWAGRAIAGWAKQQQIPSIHLSHGTGILKNYNFENYQCDTIAVFSKRSAEYYLDSGVPSERVAVVGNPGWSQYTQLKLQRASVRRSLCQRSGLDPALPIIVFGTAWNAYLSALDDRDLVKELQDFLAIYPRLVAQGFLPQLIVKDRLVSEQSNHDLVFDLAQSLDIPASQVRYELADAQSWIVAADLVVSIDSNFSIEAILAETPAINLITPFGMLAGPGFGPDAPVLHCEPAGLADVVGQILASSKLREDLLLKMRSVAEGYNCGVDGKAEERLCELIESKRRADSGASGNYVWQTLLQVDETDATQYHNWPRSELVDLAPRAPRRVLDIGCAAGKTGEYIKQKFPQAKVYGVEINRTAAELAAKRLDSVFAGRFEDFDFAAHGITPGSLDMVIVADVLEHIYDPWGVMVRLKPYLTPDAQVLASIPNTRNLALMNDLAEGNWRYEPWGLLDVTHIRFFTLKEIRRFFHETGYHVVDVKHNIDARLAGLYQENQGKGLINIDFDKFALKNVTQEELVELCALQIYVVVEPGAVDDKAFEVLEKVRAEGGVRHTNYDLWRAARQLTKAQGDLYDQHMSTWAVRPAFHLVIVNTAGSDRLAATIQSLATQYYHDLRLTVVAPDLPPQEWTDSNNMNWRHAPVDGLLEEASLALCEGGADWVGMIDAGDTVAAHSFLFLAEAVHAHPDWRFIYSDEDVLLPGGQCESPHFKPDFNLDLMRSMPYIGGLALVSRPLFESLGGFSSAMQGAEDYDLALRAYEVAGAKAMGHLPDVLYHRLKDGGRWRLPAAELVETGKRAVETHLARMQVRGAVGHGLFPGSYRVRYEHVSKPRVSVLIAVRDQLETLQRCIESVLSTTRYPDYEILIIDNDSTFPEVHAYLQGLESLGDERVRVYTHPAAASLPLLHNLLAKEAKGDYLLFLHFDAAVLQDDWLDGMMAHALRPEVGMVAPRMLRADGSVAQTGTLLGVGSTVDSPFLGEAIDQPGYFGRAHLEQNYSALGGGCLLVQKSLFDTLGGFDIKNFATDFAETDFSLRAGKQDLLAVWTPFVSVLCEGTAPHHVWRDTPVDETVAEAVHKEQEEHLYQRYLPQLARDPAYNANFSLAKGECFIIEDKAPLTWNPLPWRPLPRVLTQPADNMGCGEYRILSPLRTLVDAGKVQGWPEFNIFTTPEMARLDVDSIIFQRQIEPDQIEAIEQHKKFQRALRVFELDDLLINLPLKSIHRSHMPKDVARRLRQAVALCDRFVVSTEPLQEAYRDMHPDIRVVPNCLERARWGGFKPLRRQSARPRIGWAGGVGHAGDLEMIADVVKALAEKVDWVFMGMCPDGMRSWIKEFHPGIPVEQYPAKLASLNLDLALAPLEHNPFNESKSHLRLLEYGILGYPVVCSDVYAYKGDAPVTRVRNKYSDWVDAILEQISDMDRCARQGDLLREYVESRWMLEDNLDMWMRAWLP